MDDNLFDLEDFEDVPISNNKIEENKISNNEIETKSQNEEKNENKNINYKSNEENKNEEDKSEEDKKIEDKKIEDKKEEDKKEEDKKEKKEENKKIEDKKEENKKEENKKEEKEEDKKEEIIKEEIIKEENKNEETNKKYNKPELTNLIKSESENIENIINIPKVPKNIQEKSEQNSEEYSEISSDESLQPSKSENLLQNPDLIKMKDSIETTESNLSNKQPEILYAIEDEIPTDEYDSIINKAITFPFELDTFQKRSIIRLESHQNVLVCAHTSSGKTVIAEYGIALGKKKKRRVLYTSPIKALSNQKYRDFKKKFSDVGILTGDVSINPDAQCLIMTTEILQNSLYKNSELLNSVEWVIFDEVHYINDNERGHVWEEILILLPSGIGIIMLSATVPNYMEFAEWVGKIKKTTVYVQNTLKRIVPLEHYIFIDKDNVFLVKNSNNQVDENKIKKSLKVLLNLNDRHKKLMDSNGKYKNNIIKRQRIYVDNIKWFDKFNYKSKNDKFNKKNNFQNNYNQKQYNNNNNIRITKTHMKIEDIIDYLYETQLTPAVIFVFSIKRINEYAKMLSTKMLISKSESNKIIKFYNECINTLSNEDKQIPQIKELREMLINGIGIHHSGLLPILKEIIEILYSKGIIKILFATTSFSIGLNMPTRTVVFTDIYKYNDEKREILTSSEYLQMCGRAGRRGIDTIGYVFLCLMESKNLENECLEIKQMLKGIGTEVESKFRLSYRTIISFFSRNIKEIDEFFQESFLESKTINEIPKVMKELEFLKIQSQKLEKIDCKEDKSNFYIEEYFNLEKKLISVNYYIFKNLDVQNYLLTENVKKKNGQGRILKVFDKEINNEIFVVEIAFYTQYNSELWCIISKEKSTKKIKYEENITNNIFLKTGFCKGNKFSYRTFTISDIREIYNFQLQSVSMSRLYEDKEGYKFLSKKDLIYTLNYLNRLKYNSNELKELNPIDFLKDETINLDLANAIKEKNEVLNEIKNSKCTNCPLKKIHYNQYKSYNDKLNEIKKKEKELDPKNMEHYREFKIRLEILKKFNYIDENNIITLKGKAAREIHTTDCLLISELLLSNILNKLSIPEIVGFISGFCYSKNEIDFNLDDSISKNFIDTVNEFQDIYNKIIKIEGEYNFVDNKYDRRITFSISKAMKSWMEGKPFYFILEETELEEGKLYNLIMRIFLFLEEIINFYGEIGNKNLGEKYENIKKELMRGIMSKQSLYLQDSISIDI